MSKLKYLWINLTAIGFFPEIIVAGLVVYFGMRFFLERSKLETIGAVFVINLLGQLYFDMPTAQNWFHDLIGTLFFAGLQTFGAIANYSFLEAIKVIDLIKWVINKRVGNSSTPPDAPK